MWCWGGRQLPGLLLTLYILVSKSPQKSITVDLQGGDFVVRLGAVSLRSTVIGLRYISKFCFVVTLAFCQREGLPSLVWRSSEVLYRASGRCAYHELRSGWVRVALIELLYGSHCSLSLSGPLDFAPYTQSVGEAGS